jgi:hypothetical protein
VTIQYHCKLTDNNEEISSIDLNSVWQGTYVIQKFTYKPLGLDIFEYQLTLKYINAMIP